MLFLLPLTVLGVVLEVSLRQMPNDYKLKKEYLEKYADDIEVLLLGSSHSFYGLNPEYFSQKTFNAAYVSQSLAYDLEILKRQLENSQNIKTVVLPVSVFSLYLRLEDGADSWRVKNYVMYYGMENKGDITNNTELFSNTLPVNYARFKNYYVKNEPAVTCSNLGWGTQFKSENAQDLEATGKVAAERHTQDDNHFEANANALRSVISLCNEKGIKLVMFTPPAYKSYYKNISQTQLKETIETVNKLITECNSCSYINLLENASFVAEDFFDADHLNEKGARKLSLMVDQICLSL